MGTIARDVRRHHERLKEAIRKKLPQVVADEDIVTAPSGRRLRVPVRFLDEPGFRPDRPAGAGGSIGVGEPGEEHADPDIEVEIGLDELEEMLFEELKLPNLQPKVSDVEDEDPRAEGVTPHGPRSRLDKRRTLIEHLKDPSGLWREEQMRFRDILVRPHEVDRAVVIFVRDASGSMDRDRRYRVRVAAFWTLRWLRRQYRHVEPVFIIHDSAAEEVDEHRFFHVGVMGGTLVSSGLALAEEILETRYPAGNWNRYLIVWTDGENWDGDNPRVEQLLLRLSQKVELIGYGQVAGSPWANLGRLVDYVAARHPDKIRSGRMYQPEDVAKWLQAVFGARSREGAA